MTPEIRKTLLNLINEYEICLNHTQAERDLMKCIEARAVTECGFTAAAFRFVATTLWQDKTLQVREDLDTKLALFDRVRDAYLAKNDVE